MLSTGTFFCSSTRQHLQLYLTKPFACGSTRCMSDTKLAGSQSYTDRKQITFFQTQFTGRFLHPVCIHKPPPSMSGPEELHVLPKSRLEICNWPQRCCHVCTLSGFETMVAPKGVLPPSFQPCIFKFFTKTTTS